MSDETCTCSALDGTEPHEVSCPQSWYSLGVRHGAETERDAIVRRMRTEYPMNQHAREWADWIESLSPQRNQKPEE